MLSESEYTLLALLYLMARVATPNYSWKEKDQDIFDLEEPPRLHKEDRWGPWQDHLVPAYCDEKVSLVYHFWLALLSLIAHDLQSTTKTTEGD
jgi:hypothetical protein